jgi:hypothetical protein
MGMKSICNIRLVTGKLQGLTRSILCLESALEHIDVEIVGSDPLSRFVVEEKNPAVPGAEPRNNFCVLAPKPVEAEHTHTKHICM